MMSLTLCDLRLDLSLIACCIFNFVDIYGYGYSRAAMLLCIGAVDPGPR